MSRYKVILDTDTLNEADDLFAITYMLKSQDIFDIQAITIAPFKHSMWKKSVSESVDASYLETCKLYDYLNINDKSNIYKGSKDYYSNGYLEETEAIKKIVEIANKNEKTYILAIGCLTNIAIALNLHPEIINKVEVIWLGTNFLFGQNKDFNFKQDVEAVKYVFASNVALTIMPCSPITSNLMTSIYELEHELKGTSKLNDYLCYKFYNRYWGPHKRWPLWDISVIAYMINRDWFETMQISCPIINDDNTFTYTNDEHKITFVKQLNANCIFEDLFVRLRK